MPRITKIVGMENRDKFALVHVIIDEQEEAIVIVGGQVKLHFSEKYDHLQAHVTWPKENNPVDKTID